jgi:hypothetical protein
MADSCGTVASGAGYTVPALTSLMAALEIVRFRSARLSLLHSSACCTPESGTCRLVWAATPSRSVILFCSNPAGLARAACSAWLALADPFCEPDTPSHSVRPAAGTDRFQVSWPPSPLVPNTAWSLAEVGPQSPDPVVVLDGAVAAPTSAYHGVCSWLNVMTPLAAETVFWWLN